MKDQQDKVVMLLLSFCVLIKHFLWISSFSLRQLPLKKWHRKDVTVTALTQRTENVIITSLMRQNDVATSLLRHVSPGYLHWMFCMPLLTIRLPPYRLNLYSTQHLFRREHPLRVDSFTVLMHRPNGRHLPDGNNMEAGHHMPDTNTS